MWAVSIRLGLRYIAGSLATKGFLSMDMADMIAGDPDVAALVDLALAAAAASIAEGWYYVARRLGWAT